MAIQRAQVKVRGSDAEGAKRALRVVMDDVTGQTVFQVITTTVEEFVDWADAVAAFEANK